MKPASPMLAFKQQPLKPPSPLRPINAPKTAISHPQRRRRFQSHTRTSGQRRWRFHARDLRCPRAMAGPGRSSIRRTEPHISVQAPPVWRAPEGPEGTGGLRDRPLRAFRLACGDLAGGRARRRPEHQRSRKQQAQSRIPAAAAVGGGGAWPGFETTRRATHQRPGAAGVEGAGGSGGHGRASRSTTPSRRLACGDLAGGRARRRLEHQRSRKQQHAARTASGRSAAHGRTQRPGPTKHHKTPARHSKRGRHQPTPCASALTHP